jgi:hypothetical protein
MLCYLYFQTFFITAKGNPNPIRSHFSILLPAPGIHQSVFCLKAFVWSEYFI